MHGMHKNRWSAGLRDAVEGSVAHRMHWGKAQYKAHPGGLNTFRKELAIAKVAPKLVGVVDVAKVEEILKELRDKMLDELDATERELGLTA